MLKLKSISSKLLLFAVFFLLFLFIITSFLFIESNDLKILVLSLSLLFSFIIIYNQIIIPFSDISINFLKNDNLDSSRKLPIYNISELQNISKSYNKLLDQIDSFDSELKDLKNIKNEYNAIISSMFEALVVIDLDGNIIMLNDSACELFSLKKNNSIGESIFGLIRNSELIEFFELLITKNALGQTDINLIQNDHEKRIDARGSALLDSEGLIMGAVIVFTDITRIHQLENIRKEFVSNVSHELKTPITSIKGYVETLNNVVSDVEHKSFLNIIENNTNRLNTIIDDLLLLSRVEENKNKNKIKFIDCQFSKVIEDSISDCEKMILDNQIKIKVKCDPNIILKQNPRLMQEALLNLISNSIKYSDVGSTIFIDCNLNGKKIELTIKDEGIGIDKKHFDRLFERFYRVSESRARDKGGTGLGLAIVKHIVEMHSGEIYVDSIVDIGTSFTIVFSLDS